MADRTLILMYGYQLTMIQNIIQSLPRDAKRRLYNDKYVCGCVYRSFNELEANIFFRLTTNNGRMMKSEFVQIFTGEAKQKYQKVLRNFMGLDILHIDTILEIDKRFAKNVEDYILHPEVLSPVDVRPPQVDTPQEPKASQFLKILFEENKIPEKCKFKALVGDHFSTKLTKQQFDYIKASISYKIGLLIEGMLSVGNIENNIKIIVRLNLLDYELYYPRTQEFDRILVDLAKINLVQISGPKHQYFRISRYLQHYIFQQFSDSLHNAKVNCKVIIETNFKVYTIIQEKSDDIATLRKILGYLIKTEYQNTEFQEMIIGEINEQFLIENIFSRGITAIQYFDFFKDYIDQQMSDHKQLGKWKKLKFLGLEGPAVNSKIPSNVRQQVRLWEKLYESQVETGERWR